MRPLTHCGGSINVSPMLSFVLSPSSRIPSFIQKLRLYSHSYLLITETLLHLSFFHCLLPSPRLVGWERSKPHQAGPVPHLTVFTINLTLKVQEPKVLALQPQKHDTQVCWPRKIMSTLTLTPEGSWVGASEQCPELGGD